MDTQLKITVRNQKRILVSRYIQLHHDEDISVDIHRLILLFYDEVTSFNICNKRLQKFLAGQNLFGEQFIVDGLIFRCALYPKMEDQFSLQLLLEPNVKKATAYFFMYNIQADSFWEGTIEFNENGIVDGDDKHPNDSGTDVWTMENLPLPDYKEHSTLDLSIWTQILSIKYEDDEKEDYNLDIRMKRNVEFTWCIEGGELNQFVDCEMFKYISSENFPANDKCFNWVISVIPNGSYSQEPEAFLHCDLVRMPHTIQQFDIEWTLEVSGIKTKTLEGKKRFGHGHVWHFFSSLGGEVINNKVLKKAEKVTVSMNITIKRVWDLNNEEIKSADWIKYGIE